MDGEHSNMIREKYKLLPLPHTADFNYQDGCFYASFGKYRNPDIHLVAYVYVCVIAGVLKLCLHV